MTDHRSFRVLHWFVCFLSPSELNDGPPLFHALSHTNTLKGGIKAAIPLKAGGLEEAIKCWSKDAFAFQVGVSIVSPETLRVLTYIATLWTGLWRRDETGEQTLLPADGSLHTSTRCSRK